MFKIVKTYVHMFLFVTIVHSTFVAALDPWRQIDALHYIVTVYDEPASSFENAKSICNDIDATLVQLDDIFVREAVYAALDQLLYSQMFWIGAERNGSDPDKDWYWIDGTPVNMSLINWENSEPSGGADTVMGLWSIGKFFDLRPTLDYVLPICQKRRDYTAPWKLQTTNYNLTFYDAKSSDWDDSIATCADLNATIIQLKDDDVREGTYRAIEGAENVACFWIGATGKLYNWTWLDGTPVNMTLIQWYPGQPDDAGGDEDRLIIRTDNRTFEDKAETFNETGTICQKKRGNYCEEYLNTCRHGGVCTSNPGIYPYFICDCAAGFYGVNCKLFGTPTIFNVTSRDCTSDGEIRIGWTPSPSAPRLLYRITATSLDQDESREAEIFVGAHGNMLYYTSLSDLGTSTLYNIKITVCTGVSACIDELSDYKNTTTGFGLPKVVEDATVAQITNSLCKVSWDWPKGDPQEKIDSFKIVSTSSYVHQPQNEDTNVVVVEEDTGTDVLEYSYATVPNREYTFTIAAQSCAGLGPNTTATGECITNFAPPDKIDSPEHFEQEPSTEREILMKIPDESNGPISCVFVIVKTGLIENSEDQFQIDDLQRVSDNALSDKSPIGIEYLAVAFQRLVINGRLYNVTLGKDYLSTCDISQFGQNTNFTSNYYGARNWELHIGNDYSYYVVTSTPTGPNVTMFQRSPIDSFRNGSPGLFDNTSWIVKVFLVILAALHSNTYS